jgi:NMD protein affecting ribosome stability and mRNA decay
MAILGSLGAIFWLVLTVLAILTPIMIYLIQRNTYQTRIELKKVNQQLVALTEAIDSNLIPKQPAPAAPTDSKITEPGSAETVCSNCGKKLKYSVKFSGETKPCPKCARPIRLK